MLDIGWSELLLIGVIALLVVGPKDLPRMLRTAGQWVGRARSLARDFQRSMDDAAREADLEEFREARKMMTDINKIGSDGLNNVKKTITDPVEAATKLTDKPADPAPAEPKPADAAPAAAPAASVAKAAEPAPADDKPA